MRTTWISAVAVATICGWQTLAQTSAGVKGVVTDSSGALMPGTEITVTNLDNGARRQTVTNDTGGYEVPLLPPGRYTIAGRKQGFKQAVREGVELELNQIAQIDFTMVAGEVNETIEVQASAPQLETNTSSVGQVIETKAVSDLPLNGRNSAHRDNLGPGVAVGEAGGCYRDVCPRWSRRDHAIPTAETATMSGTMSNYLSCN